jgi:hypothetical protein
MAQQFDTMQEMRLMSAQPEIAQELREEAVRAQAVVGEALIAVARSEASGGMADRALQSLVAVRHILDEVVVYASDSNRMPVSAARELLRFVRELLERAQNIERVLHLLRPGAEGKTRAEGAGSETEAGAGKRGHRKAAGLRSTGG